MEITASTPEQIGGGAVASSSRSRPPTTCTFTLDAERRRHRGDLADDRRAERAWPRLFGKVVNMDKLVGKDFEKGLARLKANAEAA